MSTAAFERAFFAADPAYDGRFVDHDWRLQGRLEMSGNDPDSGWIKIKVGAR